MRDALSTAASHTGCAARTLEARLVDEHEGELRQDGSTRRRKKDDDPDWESDGAFGVAAHQEEQEAEVSA